MLCGASKIRWGLFVALTGFGLLLTGCGADTGAGSPQQAIDAYVAALNARDTKALAQLAPPGNDAADEIRQRLDQHGGQNIRIASTRLTNGVSPDVVSASIQGQGSAGDYSETLTLTRTDDRWHVVMGQQEPSSNKRSATTTQPT